MELKKFVEETLAQIVEGVVAANERVKDKKAFVNPSLNLSHSQFKGVATSRGFEAMPVEFDVAVTTESASEQKAGGGIFVSVVGIGAQAANESSLSSNSRVKFTVNLQLPNGL